MPCDIACCALTPSPAECPVLCAVLCVLCCVVHRRQFDLTLGLDTLTPITTIHERVKVWGEQSGKHIDLQVSWPWVLLHASTTQPTSADLLP